MRWSGSGSSAYIEPALPPPLASRRRLTLHQRASPGRPGAAGVQGPAILAAGSGSRPRPSPIHGSTKRCWPCAPWPRRFSIRRSQRRRCMSPGPGPASMSRSAGWRPRSGGLSADGLAEAARLAALVDLARLTLAGEIFLPRPQRRWSAWAKPGRAAAGRLPSGLGRGGSGHGHLRDRGQGDKRPRVIVDLYCGLGTFQCSVSPSSASVEAYDGSAAAVTSLDSRAWLGDWAEAHRSGRRRAIWSADRCRQKNWREHRR